MSQVMHMIQTKRTNKEIKELIAHTVDCWEAARSDGFPIGADPGSSGIYGKNVTKATRKSRAAVLVHHCLSKPVTTDA